MGTTGSVDFFDENDDEISLDCSMSDLDEVRVTFGSVEIREYPITVDDHPKSHDSCPLTLMWDPVRTIITTVDECEEEDESSNNEEEVTITTRRRKTATRSSSSCRHLNLHERRTRIAEVHDISLNDV